VVFVCLDVCLPCRFYYDCLMKPNAKSVVTALRKVMGGGAWACCPAAVSLLAL
jgi:flavorubredoxin